ncbi:P-loop NTPase fold protein [Streptomyces sp. NBC_00687]|uniref:P-loop NTPase fold protein n=1 Tax=Streptomyces sp. NBC_00687 TaxID=2975807 RepID=UPI0022549222|nr:P-loop NTPase fold protein [Streptomyces sp. NBC_00687]MCX4920188.1 P-loop NTPase fold protein [Streptomyces sp. NBC_00687]
MRIFMQPARRSDRIVERHYQDTIVRPVIFDEHADLLDPATLQRLRQLFPGGSAPMWGVMPGKNGANLPEIRKMEPGSWVFFSGDKRLYLGATIAAAWHSPQLAERLWGADPDSGTWEYMYALAGLRDFDTPVEELRSLLGWKTTRNIMRFQAVNTAEADILERHFSLEPHTPPPSGGHDPAGRPPVLAGVHSDTASGEDLLSNEADVEMLAQLAAATVTTPPLAVALLGEWGAGKSSFIRQMSSRVDQLAALAAEDPTHSAFTATVRQVHFNAWHYSDEQVWSSLVDHLFRALAPTPELQTPTPGAEATVEERERRAAHLARLESDQEQLDTRLARTAQERPIGFLSFTGSPLEGPRLLYTAGRLVLRDLGHGRWVLATWLAVLAGTVAAGPWLSSWLPLLLGAVAGLAAPVLSLLQALRASHTRHTSLTGRLRALLEKHQRTLAENVSTARAQLAEADAAVRLADFLTERSAPQTYEHYRGLLGTVHHDLVQLDERLHEARAEWAGAHSRQPPPLERIVLYIDDLDRCPPERVVEVLTAVHLMLALPLFVVVVAVDPRWLLTSLEHHYRELFTSRDSTPWADTQDTATPLDYLDKIFQIPFAVPPTTREKAARLIRALLTTPDLPSPKNPAQPAVPGGLPDAQETEAPTPQTAPVPAPEPESADGPTPGPDTDPTPVQLQLEETEIAFMSQMGGLTRTPRAAKKLVNLYRLARIGVDPDDLAAFVGTEAIPGEHQAVQILLALLVGSPDQAATVFRHILEAPPTSKITEALRDLPADVPAGAQAADLIEEMTTSRPVLMDTAVYQQWCPKLARFSFYTRNLTG